MASLALYLPTVVLISLVGGFLPLLRELSQRALALLLSFSAGVLLGAVFFHMLPEMGKVLTENIGWPVLTGFLLIFVMERFVFIHACEEHECDIHQMGIPAFLGISLHSLLDGIALGAGLLLPQLGPVVLLAVIIHKMPDSISISSILLSAGWHRHKVIALNVMFSLTTPVGALLAYFFFARALPRQCRRRHRHFRRNFPRHRHRGHPAASPSHRAAQPDDAGLSARRSNRQLVGSSDDLLIAGRAVLVDYRRAGAKAGVALRYPPSSGRPASRESPNVTFFCAAGASPARRRLRVFVELHGAIAALPFGELKR
jgi:zinc and cadmium transporter